MVLAFLGLFGPILILNLDLKSFQIVIVILYGEDLNWLMFTFNA